MRIRNHSRQGGVGRHTQRNIPHVSAGEGREREGRERERDNERHKERDKETERVNTRD